LKQVALSASIPVKPDGIFGQQSSHHGRDWNVACAEKEMIGLSEGCLFVNFLLQDQSASFNPDFLSVLRATALRKTSSFPHIAAFSLARVMPV